MSKSELVSVRAIITNPEGKILLLKCATLPDRGKWFLPGEKSSLPNSEDPSYYDQEIVTSIKSETGLDFEVDHRFMEHIEVDSVSVPGHKRDVITYAGASSGTLKINTNDYFGGDFFSLEETFDVEMTPSQRLVVTTWFAHHNGV